MDTDLKKEIWSYLKPMQLVYLATSYKNKPFIRPMILIFHDDRFWLATGTDDTKMIQILANDNVEFCLSITDENKSGYIRGSGSALNVKDANTRKMIHDIAKFIHGYWDDPSHPGFALLEIKVKDIEYLRLGESIAHKLTF